MLSHAHSDSVCELCFDCSTALTWLHCNMSSTTTEPPAPAKGTAAKVLRAGIIGGMGPDATIEFYQRVIKKTRQMASAPLDQDHALATIDMSCNIPSRQDAILEGTLKDLCGQRLCESAARLRASGCDFAVCVCNSAHHFQADIVRGLQHIPFLSIIDLTVHKIATDERQQNQSEASTVAVFAASGCAAAGLYQNALKKKGIEPFVPNEKNQAACMEAIYLAKAGRVGEGRALFEKALDDVIERAKCRSVILGCTELPLLVDITDPPKKYQRIKFYDTVDILATAVVSVCKNLVPLESILPPS